MKQGKLQTPSTWHEEVYHATPRCQGKRSGLTSWRWDGLFKACQIEGQKTGGCFAFQVSASIAWRAAELLCSRFGVQALCRFKGAGLIPLFLVPESKDNPDPQVGKRTQRFGVTFPFFALALIVVLRPGFGLRTLPSKLLQGVAQRLDASIASMRFGIGAAFIGDRRGACQRLQTGCVRIACSIIPDFCEQSRSQSLAGAGQTAEDLVVFMYQKKALDLLVVGSNFLKQGQQLFDQHVHQTSFGAGRDRIGRQMGLMKRLEDLGCDLLGFG